MIQKYDCVQFPGIGDVWTIVHTLIDVQCTMSCIVKGFDLEWGRLLSYCHVPSVELYMKAQLKQTIITSPVTIYFFAVIR